MTRAEALCQLSDRVYVPTIRQLVAWLAQSERVGGDADPRRLCPPRAGQADTTAEKQAMYSGQDARSVVIVHFPLHVFILGFPVFVVVADLSP